ncbi:MAG: leucine-rich repeat protein [Kiritimatiellae bacterium]|nr:leucine-rich repeat protein [Kiritimatiellia bacterium]
MKMRKMILGAYKGFVNAILNFCVVFTLVFPSFLHGATETVNGIKWRYEVVSGEAWLGWWDEDVWDEGLGPNDGWVRAVNSSVSGNLVIPATLGGFPVVGINERAFAECRNIESVVVPDGVYEIDSFVFVGCSSLTNVTIPASVEYLDATAFQSTPLTDIPDTIWANVGGWAVRSTYWQNVPEEITIEGVGHIADGLFADLSDIGNLKRLVIGQDVKRIGFSSFAGCEGLVDVSLPYGLETVGAYAFAGCSSLTKIALPEAVAEIYAHAFSGCANLKEANIPESLCGKIKSSVFYGCHPDLDLSDCVVHDLTYTKTGESYSVSGVATYGIKGAVHIPSEYDGLPVTDIRRNAFGYHSEISVVTMDYGVTNISQFAFNHCEGLRSVTISDSVENIGYMAFDGCESLTNIAWGSSVKHIDLYAFTDCIKMKNLILPNGLSSVSENSFRGCTGLESIVIPGSVTNIGYTAFSGCTNIADVVLKEGISNVWPGLFEGCISLKEVSLPSTITNIGMQAFFGCQALESIVLPAGVRAIGSSSFGQSGLRSIEIPDGVEKLAHYAFNMCENLVEARIPTSVTNIGATAFQYCGSLNRLDIAPDNSCFMFRGNCLYSKDGTRFIACIGSPDEITIPANVIDIDVYGFGCASLSAINIEGDNEHYASYYGVLYDKGLSRIVVIPDGLKRIVMPDTIADASLRGNTKIESVVLPVGATNIASSAFSDCSELREIVLPEGLEEIPDWCFLHCSNLVSVTLPSTLKRIGQGAFQYCSSLEEIEIPKRVEYIGDQAFMYCSALKAVSVPKSVLSIARYAFGECKSLESIDIPYGVVAISNCAFYGCISLKQVFVPDSVETIGNSAFGNCRSLAEVYLPQRFIGNIDASVFQGCDALDVGAIATRTWRYNVLNEQEIEISGTNPESGILIIPESIDGYRVSRIANSAFYTYGGGKFTKVVLPDIEEIGPYAFCNCSNLAEVVFTGGCKRIGSNAFFGCSSLKEAVLPDNLEEIGSYAFYGCKELSDAVFPGGLHKIGECAYMNCAALSKIRIPESLSMIESSVFDGCTNALLVVDQHLLSDVKLMVGSFEDVAAVEYAPDVRIAKRANGYSLIPGRVTELVFPSNVIEIGMCWYSTNLQQVVIHGSVTEIPERAFKGCTALAHIELPDSLVVIGANAFEDCEGLRTLVVPSEWKGTSKLGGLGIPAGCEIIYGFTSLLEPDSDGFATNSDDNAEWSYRFNGETVELISVQSSNSILFVPDHVVIKKYGCVTVSKIVDNALDACKGLVTLFVPSRIEFVSDKVLSNLPFFKNLCIIHSGELSASETWDAETVHIVSERVTVPSYVTLTIASGTVVKFTEGSSLVVQGGECIAKSVIFTHIADDAIGGDTMGDGGATVPTENAYTILGMVNDDAHTEYRYGTVALCGSIGSDVTWRRDKTYVIDGTLTVASGVTLRIPAGTVVKFTDGSALVLESGGACIAEGAIFTHIADDSVGGDTMGDGDATKPEYGRYRVDANIVEDDTTEYRYYVPTTLSATISADTILRGNRVYVASNDVTVASGATLTVGYGAIVKFAVGKSLRVQSGARLIAHGTRSRPVVFTSVKDDACGGDTNGDGDGSVPYPGDWGGVIANGGRIEASYAQFLYGGGVNGNGYGARASCFMWDNASGVFSCCRFAHSPMDGCFAQNATFANCIFDDNDRGLVSHTGTIAADNCVAANNRIGFFSHTSPLVVRNSISSLNTESAITGDGGSRTTSNCYFGNDPKFLGAANGDFRIAANSPCVDAGDAAYAPDKDYYGSPRYAMTYGGEAKPDIGIHEVLPQRVASDVDLEAVEVSVDGDSFAVGDSVTVRWKVRNVGSATAQGPWTDTISAIDASGAVVTLGSRTTQRSLAPGAMVDCEATFRLPAMAEGAWRVRLTVNSGHDVFEGVSTENNVIDGAQGVNIFVPVADTSAPFNTTSNSFVRLLIDNDSSTHVIELRTPGTIQVRYGFGFAPTVSRLSGSLASVNGRLRIIVPEGVKDIYLDISSGTETDTEYAIEIKAHSALPLIESIWPCSVANAGTQTFTVYGESMEGVSHAEFLSGADVVGAKILTLGELEATIAVDCSLFASGASYDLRFVNDCGATDLRNAVKVSATEHRAKLKYSITIPQTVRSGRKYIGFVDYTNEGDADMQAPILIITETKGGAMLSLKEDGDFASSVAFVAIGSSSPHGVLRAGDRMRLPFYFRANNSFYLQVAELDYSSTQALDSVFPSWNEYANGLVDAASRLNLNAKADKYDINDLREYALRRAYGCPSAVLHGILKDAVTQEPISHSQLGVYDGDSLVDNVTTDDRGMFSFVSLEANVEYSVHGFDANVKDNRFVLGLEEYPFITLQAYKRGKCSLNITGVNASDEVTVCLTNDISGETFVTNRVGEGWCVIDGLDDGYYRLSACSSGFNFTTNRYDIIVNEGAITNAVPVFEFMPAGVAEVSVIAISGDSVTNVCVTLYDENFCSVASGVTDGDGCVMLKCSAGNYMLGIGEGYQLAESNTSISVGRGRASTIELKVKDVPFFAAPSMGVMPLTTTFYMIATNGMANIVSCEWDFDNDGIVDSREFQPSFTYESPGEKDIALTLHFSDGSAKTFVGNKMVDVWAEETIELDDGSLTLDERSGWTIIGMDNNTFILQANGLAITKSIQSGMVLIDPDNPLIPYSAISVSPQNGNPHIIEVIVQATKLTNAYKKLRVTTARLSSAGGGGSWGPEKHSSPWISFLNMQETTLGRFHVYSWALQKKFSFVIDDHVLKSFEVETDNRFDLSLTFHDKTFSAKRESLLKKEGWEVFYGVPVSWEAEVYYSGNVKGDGSLGIKGGSMYSCGWRSDCGRYRHPKNDEPLDVSVSGSIEAELKIAVRGNADIGMTSSTDEENERQKYGYALFGVELELGMKADAKLKKADELHPDSYSHFAGVYFAGDLYFSRAMWGENVDWSVLRSKFDTSETSQYRYSWETPMPDFSAHTVKRTKTSMTVSFKSFTRPDPDYKLRTRNWNFGDGAMGGDDFEIVHTYNVAPRDSYWVDVALREGYNYSGGVLFTSTEGLPIKARKQRVRIFGGGDAPPPPPPPPPGPPPPPPGGGGGGGIIKSEDPNEVAGPLGVGAARYVKAGDEMLYTVYFENKSDASAAAQDIYITNPLSEWLDWTTFEMFDVGFNNQIDHGLDGMQSGASEVALNDTPYFVQSSVALDDKKGSVRVELHIIDKTTKYGVPEDPYAGILPPNDDTHRGEGHITYRIKVRDDAPANVVITNSASIVFDYNDPIETDPAWWNTVGAFYDIAIELDGVTTNLTLIAGDLFGELPEPAARLGYIFDGWYTGENGTGVKAAPDAVVPDYSFSLYAHWIADGTGVQTIAKGGYVWAYRPTDDGGVCIVGRKDSNGTAESLISPKPNGRLVIPSKLDGRTVTGIGLGAFAGCDAMTEVVIPDTVAEIGDYAFYGCKALNGVNIPDSVKNIGIWAFALCTGISCVDIPESVTNLGAYAFSNNRSLTNVTLNEGLETIGNATFLNTGIFDIDIPDSVTFVGNCAFNYCYSLTNVVFGKNASAMGLMMFYNCTALESVTFKGDAPTFYVMYPDDPLFGHEDAQHYKGTPETLVTYVSKDSTGWNGTNDGLPEAWPVRDSASRPIAYFDAPPPTPTPDPTPTPEPSFDPDSVIAGTMSDASFPAKAQTVVGALYASNGNLVGTMQVKFGKVSKKGVVKVSATATLLVGGKAKKVTAKAVNVALDATGRIPSTKVVFKAPIGEMALEMADDGKFMLKNASYLMAEAKVGGALKGGSRGTFRLEGFDLAVPGELQESLLPLEESFGASGGKWAFAKAATVKWAKDRVTKEYGLVVDDTNGKTNLSGLKLTYTAKSGQFKGSFKAYALEEKNGKKKLAKYTVNVIGFVTNGVGYGTAFNKKAGSVALVIE